MDQKERSRLIEQNDTLFVAGGAGVGEKQFLKNDKKRACVARLGNIFFLGIQLGSKL